LDNVYNSRYALQHLNTVKYTLDLVLKISGSRKKQFEKRVFIFELIEYWEVSGVSKNVVSNTYGDHTHEASEWTYCHYSREKELLSCSIPIEAP